VSAYVQSNDHIDLLVTFARQWQVIAYHQAPGTNSIDTVCLDSRVIPADALGQELLAENVLSIQHPYSSMEDAERAEYAALVFSYRWQPVRPAKLTGLGAGITVAILKAAHGYVYQSCEHPGWASSRAATWVAAIERAAMNRLPGYDEAATRSFQRRDAHAAV
jgi:hypothetical protein